MTAAEWLELDEALGLLRGRQTVRLELPMSMAADDTVIYGRPVEVPNAGSGCFVFLPPTDTGHQPTSLDLRWSGIRALRTEDGIELHWPSIEVVRIAFESERES